ncbi:protein KRTCAP2 homolog [Polistes fuscatus]|uniref:Protein KRTCAP2 homolog n=1 Tax=Polistes dominula TaxID=743375 RepID=A0ABM1IA52_POLDO|nr:PREDICTED: protein KRTCAP2 homolog [Polistes canadensis]XP_015177088.1 PREDICTED: protein KRTCAP2 homolog [Polistes dominula]XP_015177089.1 PREDICTED: protein KRTCAP2 homolog [Polistes dominula]XP_043491807.1 protein KRTCAP2 homolog [Polistes fuscatus]
MSVTSGISFILSSIITVLLFSGMQMYRAWLTSSQLHTILGGYVGSLLFLFVLTALGNLEATVFGKSFQQKLFPEVVFSLIISLISSGLVHRVATTTCFLFSMVTLYYMNRISQETYAVPIPAMSMHSKKRK